MILWLSLQITLSTIILLLVMFKTRFWTVEAVLDECLHPEHPTSALNATVDRKTLKKNYNIAEAVNTKKGFLTFCIQMRVFTCYLKVEYPCID